MSARTSVKPGASKPARGRISVHIRVRRPGWLPVPQAVRQAKGPTARTASILTAILIVVAELLSLSQPYFSQQTYALGSGAESLLPPMIQAMADKIKFDPKQSAFTFNQNYSPQTATSVTSLGAQIKAVAPQDPAKGINVTDPVNNIDFTLTPKTLLLSGRQNGNNIVYPFANGTGWMVYTMQGTGVKENIVLKGSSGNTVTYDYNLNLGSQFVARTDPSGNIGIFGNTTLAGNISTATPKDAELLQKAKAKAPKNTLLFIIPAPTIKELGHMGTKVTAKYVMQGSDLHMVVSGLNKGNYPLAIDPSIYVETAQKFMRGNNETNITFDTPNSLIEKGSTTGARINAWSSTSDLSTAVWGQGTAVAGGYIYSVGGAQGGTPGSSTYYAAGSSNFVVPTGVTSITVKAWGAGGGGGTGSGSSAVGGSGGGGGYAKAVLTVTPAETLTVLVGTGGAVTAAANAGGNGGGYTAVKRSTTFLIQAGGGGGGGGARGNGSGNGGAGGAGGGASGVLGGSAAGGGGAQGTNAAGGAGGTAGGSGVAGATGAANAGGDAGGSGATCTTSVSGSTGGAGGTGAGGKGGTAGTCEGGGGGGSGRFGGGGGGSVNANNSGAGGGGGGGDLVSGSSTVETAGSGVTPGNNSDTDRSTAATGGAGTASTSGAVAGANGGVVISYVSGTAAVTATVSWAQFDPTTNQITSPNPGAGTCTGWCTSSAYDLPTALTNLSLVAYNGFLYAMGGANSGGTPQTTVYIAKLGANGEPQLWHPTGGTPVYWYTDTALSNARSEFAAVAYNNHMYIMGGLTTSSTLLSSNTVQTASINPTGTFSTWTTTGTQALSANRYGLSAVVYNSVIYVVGGDATFTGSPITTVEYSKLNSDGTMQAWLATNSFTTGRLTNGGSFAAIWGGYIYIGGGCTTLNGSGYCTAIGTDVQLASINADGSIDKWNTIIGLDETRMGNTLIAWQNGLYRLGGCRAQDPSTGGCTDTIFDVDYGVINSDGDASTVGSSSASGVAPCSGGSPTSCDLPSASVGNVLNETAIINGYMYIMGGCTNNACTSVSTGVTYQAIGSDGTLQKPAACTGGTYTDSYCVSPSTLPVGLAAAATTVFGGQIYLIGGFTTGTNIYYTSVNSDGSLAAWTTNSNISTVTSAAATTLTYAYAYARANPGSAGTNPGNLYIIGGCTDGSVGCSNYSQGVYKCNISTTGAVASCSTTSQLQIGTISGASGTGLGAMAGAVYANYIYLIGGLAPGLTDLTTAIYAKFDNSNNIVTVGSGWVQGANQTATGRRRGAGFGYNGYLYVVGGYDGTSGVLADIEFAKLNVSDGSWGVWSVSSVTINQRWGLSVPVSNSFAYVIGGCTAGASPSSCSTRTNTTQTFQIYNNDSGAPAAYNTTSACGTGPCTGASGGTSLIGGSVAILNGYIYHAGGCTNMTCTTTTAHDYYASISNDGTVGTWATATADLPVARAWGKLLAAANTLYWVGGVSGAGNISVGVQACTTFSGADCTVWSSSTGSHQLPVALTNIGAAVWNNRIYVVGGSNSATITGASEQNTIYYSDDLGSGGLYVGSWTTVNSAFNIARSDETVITYANNMYILGGYDGANYLSDVQYLKINSNGSLGSATYTTSLPNTLADADGFAANGYIYLIGGRSNATTCPPQTLVAPISANTTIASGNNPTGVGAWYQTNQQYSGSRYGAGAAYSGGKAYVVGGGCNGSFVATTQRTYYTGLLSQPQVAQYSIMIDTDTDVFPKKWLLNGLDNSIGAAWQLSYESMTNTTTSCKSPAMTTWGQVTNVGNVTLGTPGTYTPLDGSGVTTNCARFFDLLVTIDSSRAYGYPDDITRGPTITDLTLEFTADPSKRLMHGRTFTGGLQQPDDTPF